MSWFMFIQRDNGDLVSEGSVVPEHLLPCMEGSENPACIFSVREIADRPDWTVRIWDRLSRALVDRPLPIIIDRVDDIIARLMADPDFSAAWAGINATRRTQLRTGVFRVMGNFIGQNRWRGENDRPEMD